MPVPVSPGQQLADSCWPLCLTPQGVTLWRRRAALMMSRRCARGLSPLLPHQLVSSLAAWPARGPSTFSQHRLPGTGGLGLRNGFSRTCQLAPVTLQYWSPRFLRGFMMSRGGVTSLPLNCSKSQKMGLWGFLRNDTQPSDHNLLEADRPPGPGRAARGCLK